MRILRLPLFRSNFSEFAFCRFSSYHNFAYYWRCSPYRFMICMTFLWTNNKRFLSFDLCCFLVNNATRTNCSLPFPTDKTVPPISCFICTVVVDGKKKGITKQKMVLWWFRCFGPGLFLRIVSIIGPETCSQALSHTFSRKAQLRWTSSQRCADLPNLSIQIRQGTGSFHGRSVLACAAPCMEAA